MLAERAQLLSGHAHNFVALLSLDNFMIDIDHT